MASARSAHRRRGSLGGISYDLSNRWYEDLSQELEFVQKEAQQSLQAAWTEAEQWRAQDVELSEMVAKLESRLRAFKEEEKEQQESLESLLVEQSSHSDETNKHSNEFDDSDNSHPIKRKNSIFGNNGILQESDGGRPTLEHAHSCYGRLESANIKKHNSSLNETEATWLSSDDCITHCIPSPPQSRRSSVSSVASTGLDSNNGEVRDNRRNSCSSRRSSCGSDISNSGAGSYLRRRSSCGSNISALVDAGYPLPTMIEEDNKEAEELVDKLGRTENAYLTLKKTVYLQEHTIEELENKLLSELEQALEKETAKLTQTQRKLIEVEDEWIELSETLANKKRDLSHRIDDSFNVYDSQAKKMEAELKQYRLYLEDEMDKLHDKLPNNNETGPPENDLASKIADYISGLEETEDQLAEVLASRILEMDDIKQCLNKSTSVFKKSKGTAAFLIELARLLKSSGKLDGSDGNVKEEKSREKMIIQDKSKNENNHKNDIVKYASVTLFPGDFQDSFSTITATSIKI